MSQNTPGTSVYHDTAHGTVRVAPVADRPIRFSAPMVRALLEGRKTQHREIIKPQGYRYWQEFAPCGDLVWRTDVRHKHGPTTMVLLPQAGGRMWVRETWAQACECDEDDQPASAMMTYYRADGEPFSRYLDPDTGQERDGIPWRPSTNMPRWASRLTLVVTDVRVQRLQDISEEDADAEGFGGDFPHVVMPGLFHDADEAGAMTIAECYGRLWDHINGPGSWDANPFIAAYSFTVHYCNIDAMPAPTAAAAE